MVATVSGQMFNVSSQQGNLTTAIAPNSVLRAVGALVTSPAAAYITITYIVTNPTNVSFRMPLARGMSRNNGTTIQEGVIWNGAIQTGPDVGSAAVNIKAFIGTLAATGTVYASWDVELP